MVLTRMLAKINRLKLEFVYFLSMLIIGTMLVFMIPPFQVADEIAHFLRAYQISYGMWRSPAQEFDYRFKKQILFYADVPTSLTTLSESVDLINGKNYYSPSTTIKFFSIPVTYEGHVREIITTGAYSPFVYAPQAALSFVARTIDNSVGSVYYGARLGALLFVIICITLAIRLLPEKKLLIFVIAFSPMFLWEVASCSSDSVIYSVAVLGTAYLLSLRRSTDPLSKSDFIRIVVLAIALGLSKQVYGTILLLYFLIPAERLGGKRNFYLFGIFVLATCLLSAFAWTQFARAEANVTLYHTGPSVDVDIAKQLAFIFNDPLGYLQVFCTTWQVNHTSYFRSFIGVLGWLTVGLPHWFYTLYGFLLILSGCFGSLNLTNRQRIWILLGVLSTILVTYLFMYITWTPVQAPIIEGVQGRYFIPSAMMLFAAFSCIKK